MAARHDARLQARLAAAVATTAPAAADLRDYRYGPSQPRMMLYDAALWEARVAAAGDAATLVRRPPAPLPPSLRALDLGGLVVTDALLRAVRTQTSLRELTLTTLAAPPWAAQAPASLASVLAGLPRLQRLALRRMPDPQPFWGGTYFVVGSPPLLQAVVAAAPALRELVAEDVHDDADVPETGAGGDTLPLTPALRELCAAIAVAPCLRRAELMMGLVPDAAPSPHWRLAAGNRAYLLHSK